MGSDSTWLDVAKPLRGNQMAPAGACSTKPQDEYSGGGSGPWVKLEAAKSGIVIAPIGRIFVNIITICL